MIGEHEIILEDLERIISADLPWHTLAGKTILITGANGFLPAYMVKSLLFLNDKKRYASIKVIALVRNLVKAQDRFGHLLDRSDFEIIVQDVAEKINIETNVHFIRYIHIIKYFRLLYLMLTTLRFPLHYLRRWMTRRVHRQFLCEHRHFCETVPWGR